MPRGDRVAPGVAGSGRWGRTSRIPSVQPPGPTPHGTSSAPGASASAGTTACRAPPRRSQTRFRERRPRPLLPPPRGTTVRAYRVDFDATGTHAHAAVRVPHADERTVEQGDCAVHLRANPM